VTYALLAGSFAVFLGALAVGIKNWRLAVVGLVIYIPISGIAIDAAYGHRVERAVAVLAKDFLFVVPAYVGFLLWAWRRRVRISFPGAPVTLLLALAAIVVAQAFNPNLPKPLVGLIGVKVWLFYVPLIFLGYHLVRTREELHRLFGLMTLLALVPAGVGLIEAALIYGGHAGAVYRLYGNAAAAVTQEFVTFGLPGGGSLRRIPSTFSSFYQYYLFVAVMLAVAYGWWRGSRLGSRRSNIVAAAVWLLLLAASFLTGVRAGFFMTPFLILLMVALGGRGAVRFGLRWLLPATVIVLALGSALSGSHLLGVWTEIGHVGRQEFGDVIVRSSKDAVHLTTFGLGTGIDSVGARYAYSNDTAWQEAIFPVLGRWEESWYVKTWIELGVAGLAIVLALFGTIIVRGIRAHLTVRDPGLRAPSAALLAVVIWTVVYIVKSQYIDLDPLNVYFWLFVGLLFRVPTLAEAEPVGEVDEAPRARPLEAVVSE
jgi:hypothetical protein